MDQRHPRQVIDYLAGLHPKVILFDVMLDHEGTPTADSQLVTAIAGAGNVVLVCTADDPPLLRGFTAMSEAMAAEDVLAVIQDYLDEMSSLILKWDGTIDKYVGDEVVALWNAPVAQPTHALLAIRCAYDLIDHAPALEAKLATRGLPPISWGIGVNTGPAVVGNMGSKDRLQYTALGDTVNTAARFCSAAPAFNLLIGWPTYDACSDYIAVDEMPGLQLKGKSAEKFRLFRVTAIREEKTSPWVQFPTEIAITAYSAHRQAYAKQAVFAAARQDEA